MAGGSLLGAAYRRPRTFYNHCFAHVFSLLCEGYCRSSEPLGNRASVTQRPADLQHMQDTLNGLRFLDEGDKCLAL